MATNDDFINNNNDDGVLPAKKITKTTKHKERITKKVKEAKEIKEAELVKNDSEDEELLGFIESNGGRLEEPKPLFELNADGSLPELPKFAYKILEQDFGHKTFRPHQAESIVRIACGLSTVVVLSTGKKKFPYRVHKSRPGPQKTEPGHYSVWSRSRYYYYCRVK